MSRPPAVELDTSALVPDPGKRREMLRDVFGQYLLWVRNQVSARSRNLAESPDARDQLGRLFREPYDRLSVLREEDRAVAYQFAQEVMDRFAVELLRLLANSGLDLPVGIDHAARFRLVLELVNRYSGEVEIEETLNRGGGHFPDLWGRWLNRFGRNSEQK